jgi:CDP-glycerol glycerophosphotransferase (TagB/SpsB family)
VIWQKQAKSKEKLRLELGIPQSNGIIVLATEPLVEGQVWTERQREQLIKAVVSTLKELPDKQLVIKLHPDESMETYGEILSSIGKDKAIVCRDVELYELLHACELLLAGDSTVGLEAMLFDKPVIVVNFTGRPSVMGYAESGAALGVYKEENLAPAIRKALYDPLVRKELEQNRKKFIEKHVYKRDGQASKRVAELIVRLSEKAKTRQEQR